MIQFYACSGCGSWPNGIKSMKLRRIWLGNGGHFERPRPADCHYLLKIQFDEFLLGPIPREQCGRASWQKLQMLPRAHTPFSEPRKTPSFFRQCCFFCCGQWNGFLCLPSVCLPVEVVCFLKLVKSANFHPTPLFILFYMLRGTLTFLLGFFFMLAVDEFINWRLDVHIFV